MTLRGGYWREAATLILAGKHSVPGSVNPTSNDFPTDFDYKVLMLKRSGKTKFLPETNVFPGGAISEADFSPKWDNLFSNITGTSLKVPDSRFMHRHRVPPLFEVERGGDVLPAEVAFRICALRETFEECGVLLITRGAHHSAEELVDAETSRTLNLPQWRRRVNKDASQFLELCTELKAVPNIWSLHEWSNWLTPVMQKVEEPPKRPRRFDTIFYVCCLNSTPDARVDNRETTEAQWQNPGELIGQHHRKETEMIGPQLYELARMCNFKKVSDLVRFSSKREVQGLERWMPVIVLCTDGLMTVLPGDDMYPHKPDFDGTSGPVVLEQTLEENHRSCKCHNRTPRTSGGEGRKIMCNIMQSCGHASPHPGVLATLHSIPKGKL